MDYNTLKNKMKAEALDEQTGKFYEMTSKGKLAGTGKEKSPESPFGTVSNAPSQTVTGAKPALGESGKTFTGSGKYEYGLLPDGAFMILKSGRGAAPGTVVKPGMKGFDEIKKEFEAVKAGKSVSSKPRSAAPKSAPKSEAPKPRISPTGPTEYERTLARNPETSGQIADRLERSLDLRK